MARDIDKKKTQKALRKLRKAKARAEAENGPGLTDWEKEFFEEVEERLETYGSAFADPEKGHLDEALSVRQSHIVKEIDKKARKSGTGLKRGTFKQKNTGFKPNARDIHSDIDSEPASNPASDQHPQLRSISGTPSILSSKPTHLERPPSPKSPFRVIQGGKTTD